MTVPLQRLSASQAYRQSLEALAFESTHDGPIDAEKWASITASGGSVSHVAASSAHVMAVSTASGSRAVLRSHSRPRAAAGRSRSCVVACRGIGTGNTSQVKRWGMFDDESGYFFQLSGEQLSAVRRSKVSGSVVDSSADREQWTLNNATLDVRVAHVYEIREVWPNGDAVFLIDGKAVHQIDTDGAIDGPAFRTARLPVSVEIVNTAASFADEWRVYGASVAVEGQLDGKRFDAEAYNATVGATLIPLLSVRVAATVGGQANLSELVAESLRVIAGGDCRLRWVLNGTLTGASFAAHPDAASCAEVDTTASAITVGTARSFGYVAGTSFSVDELAASVPPVRIQGDGSTRDVLTLAAQRIGGSDVAVRAVLTWKEIR